MEQEDEDFIRAQIHQDRCNAKVGVFLGKVLMGIIAIFPAYMWNTELLNVPRIFSVTC